MILVCSSFVFKRIFVSLFVVCMYLLESYWRYFDKVLETICLLKVVIGRVMENKKFVLFLFVDFLFLIRFIIGYLYWWLWVIIRGMIVVIFMIINFWR